jgi:hypothetical protein
MVFAAINFSCVSVACDDDSPTRFQGVLDMAASTGFTVKNNHLLTIGQGDGMLGG